MEPTAIMFIMFQLLIISTYAFYRRIKEIEKKISLLDKEEDKLADFRDSRGLFTNKRK